jgi:hypothetical protein
MRGRTPFLALVAVFSVLSANEPDPVVEEPAPDEY